MVEAIVEYDYDAENDDELTLRVGDIITNIDQQEGGWWDGTLKGQRGVFPDNFVKVVVKDGPKGPVNKVPDTSKSNTNGVVLRAETQHRKCRVVYSYQPANEDELELNADDVIEVLEEVEEGWWKGVLRGRTGVFPSNFVEIIHEGGGGNNVRNEDDTTDNKPKMRGSVIQDAMNKLKSAQTDTGVDKKNISSQLRKSSGSENTAVPTLPPKRVLTNSSPAYRLLNSTLPTPSPRTKCMGVARCFTFGCLASQKHRGRRTAPFLDASLPDLSVCSDGRCLKTRSDSSVRSKRAALTRSIFLASYDAPKVSDDKSTTLFEGSYLSHVVKSKMAGPALRRMADQFKLFDQQQ